MTKEQKQLAVIVGMLPVLALAVLSATGKKKPGSVPPGGLPAIPAAVNPGVRVSPAAPAGKEAIYGQNQRAEGAWGRDPFISDVYKSGQASSELKLQGISFRKDGVGFAFINNEIVKKGDTIQGYEVAEVLKDRVLLKKGSQSFYLAFPEE